MCRICTTRGTSSRSRLLVLIERKGTGLRLASRRPTSSTTVIHQMMTMAMKMLWMLIATVEKWERNMVMMTTTIPLTRTLQTSSPKWLQKWLLVVTSTKIARTSPRQRTMIAIPPVATPRMTRRSPSRRHQRWTQMSDLIGTPPSPPSLNARSLRTMIRQTHLPLMKTMTRRPSRVTSRARRQPRGREKKKRSLEGRPPLPTALPMSPRKMPLTSKGYLRAAQTTRRYGSSTWPGI
mmetsp:Transcript_3375/g.7472  ORF Transcript_3375/g.7472 Transcript_3375/m.7472 type:complete len:236 (-) Transcript_3375:1103-1810(-)